LNAAMVSKFLVEADVAASAVAFDMADVVDGMG
jgi:hypothetical protein